MSEIKKVVFDEVALYFEVTENTEISATLETEENRSTQDNDAFSKGGSSGDTNTSLSVGSIEKTIRVYTQNVLNAFKGIAAANINKVNLEFGIKIGATGGIPYITQGTAESNLKISVECTFPEKKVDDSNPEEKIDDSKTNVVEQVT